MNPPRLALHFWRQRGARLEAQIAMDEVEGTVDPGDSGNDKQFADEKARSLGDDRLENQCIYPQSGDAAEWQAGAGEFEPDAGRMAATCRAARRIRRRGDL